MTTNGNSFLNKLKENDWKEVQYDFEYRKGSWFSSPQCLPSSHINLVGLSMGHCGIRLLRMDKLSALISVTTRL